MPPGGSVLPFSLPQAGAAYPSPNSCFLPLLTIVASSKYARAEGGATPGSTGLESCACVFLPGTLPKADRTFLAPAGGVTRRQPASVSMPGVWYREGSGHGVVGGSL